MGTMATEHPFTEDDLAVVDTEDRRPGVPMSLEAHPAEPEPGEIPRQVVHGPVLKRADLDEPTPVFGTAQPPRGLSGALRAMAYGIPDHRPSHWIALVLADRVDVIEHGAWRPLKWALLAAPVAVAAGVAIARRRRSPWARAFG